MTAPLPDFSGLLAQAQQMQQKMVEAQEGLGDIRATGTSGGGLVTAVVDGHGELLGLSIEPAAYDADDPDALDTIADLVVAAVRDAKADAHRVAADQLSQATGGLAALGESLGDSLGPAMGSLGGLLDAPTDEDDQPPGAG